MKKWTVVIICILIIASVLGYRHFDSFREKTLFYVVNPKDKEILEIRFVKTPYQNDGLGLFIDDSEAIEEFVTELEKIRVKRV